jgi:poly-gamma-glutamate synthesis protein (capsule biosynthesis protein)
MLMQLNQKLLASPFFHSESSPPTPPSHRILFGGDIMLDRAIRTQMEQHGVDHVFAQLKHFFHSYDLVIANLEGAITTNQTRSVNTEWDDPNHFTFTFDPSVAKMLHQNNVKALSLANNHSADFGRDGVKQTKHYLKKARVSYFGATGFEVKPSDRVVIINDIYPSLALVGYNEFVSDGLALGIEDIAFARSEAEIVIVMSHWGPEYKPVANSEVVNVAHQLIEAGADLIIGSHPHVVQQKERYKGKTIYYSLGNFVFDQYFDPRFIKGLLVGIEICSDGSMQFTEFPIVTETTGQTVLQPKRGFFQSLLGL